MGQINTTNEVIDRKGRNDFERYNPDWTPSLTEVIGSALRLDNVFGAHSARYGDVHSFGEGDPGYSPFNDPMVPTEAMADVSLSRSRRETAQIVYAYKKRQNDREIMSQANGGDMLIAELLAGVSDPVNLLFGGGLALERGILATFARGFSSGGKAGLKAGVASEALLSGIQSDRTTEESLTNIFAGAALSATTVGMLSMGRYARMMNPKQFQEFGASVADDLSSGSPKTYSGEENAFPRITFDPTPNARRNAPGIGSRNSRNTPARPVLPKTGDVPTWSYLDSVQQFMFPGARTRNSPLRSVADVSENLVENNTLKNRNVDNGLKSPQSVETLAKQHMGAMVMSLGDINKKFQGYLRRVTGREEGVFVSSLKDRVGDLTGQTRTHLSVREFREEITKTLRSGQPHIHGEVNEAARAIRQILDQYGDDAVKYGILTPDQLNQNHVPRMWQTGEVNRRRDVLVARIVEDQRRRGIIPDRADIEAKIDAIAGSGRAIEGMDESGPRGVFQERSLDITEELYDDFLNTDIDDILRSYIRVASVDIELARKFGRVDMRDQIDRIKGERDSLINSAKTPEERAVIADRATADIEAIEALRDVLRGIYGLPENPYGLSSRLARIAMDFNNIVMLGGATFSSLTDAARIVMTVGLQDTFKAMNLAIKDFSAAKAAAHEVKLSGTALDMALQTRIMALAGMEDMAPRFSKAEEALGYATSGFFMANLLSPWNAFIKQFAGIAISHKMVADMISWRGSAPTGVKPLSTAQTGTPFTTTAYQGRRFKSKNATTEKMRANKAGKGSFLGEGSYVSPDVSGASRYADVDDVTNTKNIHEVDLTLNNPRVIKSRKELFDIYKEAVGDDRFNEWFSLASKGASKEADALADAIAKDTREYLINSGHDGAVIDMSGLKGKDLKESKEFFLADQAVSFDRNAVKSKGIYVKKNAIVLDPLKQARLLSAGIDRSDAIKIAELFDAFGETIHDVHLPNTQLWADLPGWTAGTADKMRRAYRAALARDVDATIVTPGAGDQPLWAHSTVGRLVAQYKSFGFAAANKVLVPGLQYKDAAQLHGAMMMVFFGGAVASMKEGMRGDHSEKSWDEFVVDGIDQSGLLGWYFQANNMLEAMSDGRLGVRPLTGQPTGNFSDTFKMGQISPTLGTVSKAGSILSDVVTGDVDYNTRKRAMGLIPGNTMFYLRFGELMRTRQNLDKVNTESEPSSRLR
jgi:hypothetical protein